MTIANAVIALATAVGSVAGTAIPTSAPPHEPVTGVMTRVAGAPDRGLPWSWPLDPRPELVRSFDPPDQPWLPGHRGVDLRAHAGQVVHAPAAGVVTFAGLLAGRGVVVVLHASGLRSTFQPVGRAPRVGTSVSEQEPIGIVTGEAGHCAPDACLHWGVVRGRTYLDPLSLLARAPVVLMPLD